MVYYAAKTYRSCAAVMVLMTWRYVTETALLLSAEINMVIEVVAVRARAAPLEEQQCR
jgi:uncharacterized BrkB/YihY/UPF0761 family membrane protein